MSFMMLLSNGAIVSRRGSGTPIVASWLTGILVPYAVTWTRSSRRRRGPARAHGRELVAGVLDALVHPAGGILSTSSIMSRPPPGSRAAMIVPIRSPRTTRSMFDSSSRLKTYSGTRLSMHRDSAVVSITFRPRSIASRWVSSRDQARVRVLARVGVQTPVDAVLAHQDRLRADLERAQGGGGVGGEERVAGAGGEDHHPALLQMADRPAADVRLGDLRTLMADCTRVCTPICSSASET